MPRRRNWGRTTRIWGALGLSADEIERSWRGGRDMSGGASDVSDWWSTAIIDMAPGRSACAATRSRS
jgi:hypothetical protein